MCCILGENVFVYYVLYKNTEIGCVRRGEKSDTWLHLETHTCLYIQQDVSEPLILSSASLQLHRVFL